MSYRIYIKNDYKTVRARTQAVRTSQNKNAARPRVILFLLLVLGVTIISLQPWTTELNLQPIPDPESITGQKITTKIQPINLPEKPTASTSIPPIQEQHTGEEWETIRVREGDNLSLIFQSKNLSPTTVHNIVSLDKNTAMLKRIMPGQVIQLKVEDNKFAKLKYEPDLITSLLVSRQGDVYSSELIITELEVRTSEADAIIENSLFLAGQDAGLSDKLIMQLVAIYGWDIDFALDIRKGDRFRLVYEELYKDGLKVRDGNILAAEFINRGRQLRTVRYTPSSGRADYYSDTGASMRKAFLRTPLKFNRISSRFNKKRKHPILNKIRAHNGVDYSAPSGTPIKATGDGRVVHAARKGGYGRTVIIEHGGKYTTLYAHMSKYARGIKRGKRVNQGQVIGYVGKSGLATGPHLHYEFRVNGIHRNPLTVKLPKAESIPAKDMSHFKSKTTSVLARLDFPLSTDMAGLSDKNISDKRLAFMQN